MILTIGCQFFIKEQLNKVRIFQQNLLKTFLNLLLLVVIFFTFTFPQNSYALDQGSGLERLRSCDGSGNPSTLLSGLQTTPVIGDSPDLVFDMGNPVCLAIAVGTYATVKIAIFNMNRLCGTGGGMRYTPSILLDFIDIAKATRNAVNTSCTGAIVTAGTAISSFVATLGAIYAKAKQVYDTATICGHEWRKANVNQYDLSTPDQLQLVNASVQGYIDAKDTSSAGLSFENEVYREWYYGGVEVEDNVYGYDIGYLDINANFNADVDGNGTNDVSADVGDGASGGGVGGGTGGATSGGPGAYINVNDKNYHFGADSCLDPTRLENGKYPKQRYYMKGSQIANFNCEQYLVFAGGVDPKDGSVLTNARAADFKKAYNCCKGRSANYICIEYSGTKMFCKAGSRCIFKNNDEGLVTFEATRKDNNLICASTYDLCPYNFSVSGGSQICDYFKDGIYNTASGKWDMITTEQVESGNCSSKSAIRNDDCTFNNKAGKCQNYCQQLTHCTTTNDSTYKYESELNSPYFSSACFDFVGDSRNRTSYNSGFIMGSQRHFSAPIAQCVKETMENVFYNRFGHSKCLLSIESPLENGACASNDYEPFQTGTNTVNYKKGNQVQNKSFFATLQDNLHTAIKIALTLSITFYGVTTLLGVGTIKKSELILYIIKMGLVLYFATSTAWQDHFFNGLYNTSSDLSQMVFKIDVSSNSEQRDGCQFGDMTKTNEGGTIVNSAYKAYPEGKEYLALWDTLDCKIARYLGFGPEVSAANIAMLFLSGIFTGAYGLYFSLAIMFFGFFFLVATIRALHIFLSSATSIIIMVYVSPIVIPTVMFKKTANIFKSWATQLVGLCLQPLILFAYIAIFITIMDKVLIGSATFHGAGPNKTISCKAYCADSDGNKVASCAVSQSSCDPECDNLGNDLIDPMDNSFVCLININSFGKFPGLEIIGVSVPILINVFDGNIKEKVLTLVKAALVMYILCQFMDQIPEMASYLMGGSGLSGEGGGVMGRAKGMLGKTMGAAAAIGKRGRRGAWKGIRSKAKEYADHINR